MVRLAGWAGVALVPTGAVAVGPATLRAAGPRVDSKPSVPRALTFVVDSNPSDTRLVSGAFFAAAAGAGSLRVSAGVGPLGVVGAAGRRLWRLILVSLIWDSTQCGTMYGDI